MPRRGRQRSATDIYHVMIRGNNKEKIFSDEWDYKKMYRLMKLNLNNLIEIYAYCIMPNHLHLIIGGTLSNISSYMSKIEIGYALYYNEKKERVGHVFQDRFKSECIETRSYFLNCVKYIHNNPVKAHIVPNASVYLWSSLKEYQLKHKEILCDKAIVYWEKNTEFFLKKEIEITQVVMDLPDEEEQQRKEYFNNRLKKFLWQEKLDEIEFVLSTDFRKKFCDIVSSEKIITVKEADRTIKEMKGKYLEGTTLTVRGDGS